MKLFTVSFLLIICSFFNCKQSETSTKEVARSIAVKEEKIIEKPTSLINPTGTTIQTRFLLPEGFKRVQTQQNSFAQYLQNLPLKPDGSKVKYYNGIVKDVDDVYVAVVDMDVGKRDLQQCADAIMRLRGEYLWQQKQYSDIHFNFTNGMKIDYTKWMEGNRIKIKGNKTNWIKSKPASNTYKDFRSYMNLIFTYAGTLSLSKELKTVAFEEMQIGDIFIQGGSPGHAVIVVDMAKHENTDEKLFLLAQSYMPAQETQILQNYYAPNLSPWYSNQALGQEVNTPEWGFIKSNLKRFD